MKKVHSVEEYIEVNTHFKEELEVLRALILSTNLEENIKWSAPTYSLKGKNVLGIGAFKHHFCIWFFNGVFLKDEHNRLETAQEKTKALRQLRFNTLNDINKPLVLDYVREAIENQELGKEIKPKRTTKKDILVPELLNEELKTNSKFKAAFNALSPSCQREYCNYINEAKREATKISRLEKIKPIILNGKGLHDQYKNC
ncbi:YdeI family protein [Lacinutrix sp.]|uniref:YdeI/OmpD-associated family protein n=1 Tax=Lacinutrix sp. TaxID=1937692 RepID=UPI0035C7B8DD